jgi:hypothetical protein
MKKPYESPPLWIMLGFLSGWLYARPSLALGIVWGIAHFAMLTWIVRDVEASRLPREASDGVPDA